MNGIILLGTQQSDLCFGKTTLTILRVETGKPISTWRKNGGYLSKLKATYHLCLLGTAMSEWSALKALSGLIYEMSAGAVGGVSAA